MDYITERACAKINLTLSVGKKRADGYHDISSVMQTVSLCDTVKLTKADTISLECSRKSLPTGETNLAYRAAALFFAKTGIGGGVSIYLKKYIPVAAGLGGGSADAAAVLRGLNKLYGAGLGLGELCNIGAQLGADIPFCIMGGTALAAGIGERLTPITNNVTMQFVVAAGGEGASTKMMYELLDETDERILIDNDSMVTALSGKSLDAVTALMANDFEIVAEPIRPTVTELKRSLVERGARAAMMSGSGTSVFGVFATRKAAVDAASTLRREGYFAAVCSKSARLS